ncbi:MAG: alpha/beta hydrolase [Candidatus Omnitrophota bacterium]
MSLFVSGCVVSSNARGTGNKDDQRMISSTVLTQDNKEIHYDLYAQGHKRVIILAHGFYNSKKAVLFKEMAEMLSDEYDVIVFDFRGHGKSKGLFTWTVKEYQDLQAILDYAHTKYEKIGVIGFSLGAASSIIAASRTDRIDSLIAVSPPSDFNKIDYQVWRMGVMENVVYNVFQEGRIGKGVKPGWPWLRKIKPIDVIDQIGIPVLFVHGKKDWLIQPWHSQRLFEKAKGTKSIELLEEGTHAEYIFRRNKEETVSIFKEWFRRSLNGGVKN